MILTAVKIMSFSKYFMSLGHFVAFYVHMHVNATNFGTNQTSGHRSRRSQATQ